MAARELKARLILEDGSVFEGVSFSVPRSISGEVVFNTGMVGYCESFTDPSYWGQILCLTYPLIGNYGVPAKKIEKGVLKGFESDKVHITALIVSEYSEQHSHYTARKSLQEWLLDEKIPAIYGIDTRALTKRLRERGVMLGKIVIGNGDVRIDDPNKRNLVAEVSCKKPIVYQNPGAKKRVVLIDTGVKFNIIRSLLRRNVEVIRVPWDYGIFNGKFEFDGVLIGNGPGDPKMADVTIETAKKILEQKIPAFGLCLGHQIMALAAGANTYKLKYGHRSQNQPVQIVGTNKCYITSQNHGYAVDEKSLPKNWSAWLRNINDGTNEGIVHKSGRFFTTQFHPEACPGPLDTGFMFDKFVRLLR